LQRFLHLRQAIDARTFVYKSLFHQSLKEQERDFHPIVVIELPQPATDFSYVLLLAQINQLFRDWKEIILAYGAGAQRAKVQVTWVSATLPQHPLRDLQYLLPPAPLSQTIHVQRASNHIVRRLAKRKRGGLTSAPNRPRCELLRFM
jgi:hypothetical protein